MRFKGQFSQPVGQGGLHMPETSHAMPPRLNNSLCANRPTVAPRAFAPKSKTNELRPLPPWPLTEIRFRSHEFGHFNRHSTQTLKRVAATQGNDQQARSQCPTLAAVPATKKSKAVHTATCCKDDANPIHLYPTT